MNMMNRVVRLSAALGVGFAALIAMAPASADVARYQILTLEYDHVNYYLGAGGPGSTAYPQSFTLTLNPCDGTFSGAGLVPSYGESLTEGSTKGALISYTTNYTVGAQDEYEVTVDDAMLSPNYSFGGIWSDNYSGGPSQSGVVRADAPIVTSTAYRNHDDFVAHNPHKNDAAHSCIGMPIVK